MIRNVQDLAYPSGQPNNPLTGGGYYNTSAFQPGPNLESIDAVAIDNRASGSASIVPGTLYVEQFTAANTGGAFYVPSTVAGQQIPQFHYGVFKGGIAPGIIPYTSPNFVSGASTGQNQLRLTQVGDVQALCVTGATAIAAGSFLIADGAGHLTTGVGLTTAPVIGTPTTNGTAGSSTVTYQVYARNAYGLDSPVSNTGSIATANATLSFANSINVPVTFPVGTTQLVLVRASGGATQGVIAIVPVQPTATAATLLDTGAAAGGAYVAPTVGTYASGTILAIAKGALAAATATPTLVAVTMGGT